MAASQKESGCRRCAGSPPRWASSPTTVNAAYRSLRGRGLVAGAGRRGTSVRGRPAHRTALVHRRFPPARSTSPPVTPIRRCSRRSIAYSNASTRGHTSTASSTNYRASATCSASCVRRGRHSSRHVAVVSGALDGIERVLVAQLRAGDRIGVEDPGFCNVLDLVAALGLDVVPVAIDERGILPADARSGARTGHRGARRHAAGAESDRRCARRRSRPRAATRAARASRRCSSWRTITPARLPAPESRRSGSTGANAGRSFVRPRRRMAPICDSAALAGDRETDGARGRSPAHRLSLGESSAAANRLSSSNRTLRVSVSVRARSARLCGATRTLSSLRSPSTTSRRGVVPGLNVWVPVPEEVPVVQSLLVAGFAVSGGERFRLRAGPAIRVTISTLAPAQAPALADAIAASARIARALRSFLRSCSQTGSNGPAAPGAGKIRS